MALGSVARSGMVRAPIRHISTFGRDGSPEEAKDRSAVRFEDRRATYQVAVPPVVITGGTLAALFGLGRANWALFCGGILAVAGGQALRSAWNRLKSVPSDTPR